MGNLGWAEIMVVLVIALIVFGPRKLPELGKTLGQSLAQFRRASEDFKRTWEAEVETEKRRLDVYQPIESHIDDTATHEVEPQTIETHGAMPATEPSAEVAGVHSTASEIIEPSAAIHTEAAAVSPESSASKTRRDWT